MSSVTSVSPRTLGDVIPGGLVRSIALVFGGAIFVGLTAQVSIPLPFTPVPLTLQTFSVLLVGAALGSVRGVCSMALYLLAGVAGVPWFADQQSGWAFASFGYIVGFVAAAWLVGWLAERGADRRVVPTIGMMALGNVVIYLFGVAGLMVLAACQPPLSYLTRRRRTDQPLTRPNTPAEMPMPRPPTVSRSGPRVPIASVISATICFHPLRSS